MNEEEVATKAKALHKFLLKSDIAYVGEDFDGGDIILDGIFDLSEIVKFCIGEIK